MTGNLEKFWVFGGSKQGLAHKLSAQSPQSSDGVTARRRGAFSLQLPRPQAAHGRARPSHRGAVRDLLLHLHRRLPGAAWCRGGPGEPALCGGAVWRRRRSGNPAVAPDGAVCRGRGGWWPQTRIGNGTRRGWGRQGELRRRGRLHVHGCRGRGALGRSLDGRPVRAPGAPHRRRDPRGHRRARYDRFR